MAETPFTNVKLSTPAREIKELLVLTNDAFKWRTLLQLSQESCNILMHAVYVQGQQYPTFSRIEHAKLSHALSDFMTRVRQAGLEEYVNENRPTIGRWFLYQRYWVRKGGMGASTAEDEVPAADAAGEIQEPTQETTESPSGTIPYTAQVESHSSSYPPPLASTGQYPYTSTSTPFALGYPPATAQDSSHPPYGTVNFPPQVPGHTPSGLPLPQSTEAQSTAYPPYQYQYPPESGSLPVTGIPISPPDTSTPPPAAEPSPAQAWTTSHTIDGTPYYICYENGAHKYSTYWHEYIDHGSQGRYYYYNSLTKETAWTPPSNGEFKPASSLQT